MSPLNGFRRVNVRVVGMINGRFTISQTYFTDDLERDTASLLYDILCLRKCSSYTFVIIYDGTHRKSFFTGVRKSILFVFQFFT